MFLLRSTRYSAYRFAKIITLSVSCLVISCRTLRASLNSGFHTSRATGALTTNSTPPEDLHDFGVRHVTKGLGRITEGIMVKGEGSYVVYDDGRRMLDFTCGIGVTNLGKWA
jgi:hypothetical protein